MTSNDGHDQPCYYCGEKCNKYAGNPGRWPIPLCHKDDPGRVEWHHIECVTDRLIENHEIPLDSDPNYAALNNILLEARNRASEGKGRERHANDLPFEEQPMIKIMDMVGSGFATGQAIKKINEATGMEWPRARLELLDAIVYLAGAVVWGDKKNDHK